MVQAIIGLMKLKDYIIDKTNYSDIQKQKAKKLGDDIIIDIFVGWVPYAGAAMSTTVKGIKNFDDLTADEVMIVAKQNQKELADLKEKSDKQGQTVNLLKESLKKVKLSGEEFKKQGKLNKEEIEKLGREGKLTKEEVEKLSKQVTVNTEDIEKLNQSRREHQKQIKETKEEIAKMKIENKEAYETLYKESQNILQNVKDFKATVAENFKGIANEIKNMKEKIDESTSYLMHNSVMINFETDIAFHVESVTLSPLNTAMNMDKIPLKATYAKWLNYLGYLMMRISFIHYVFTALSTDDEDEQKEEYEIILEYMEKIGDYLQNYKADYWENSELMNEALKTAIAKTPPTRTGSLPYGMVKSMAETMAQYYTENRHLIFILIRDEPGISDHKHSLNCYAELAPDHSFRIQQDGYSILIVRSRTWFEDKAAKEVYEEKLKNSDYTHLHQQSVCNLTFSSLWVSVLPDPTTVAVAFQHEQDILNPVYCTCVLSTEDNNAQNCLFYARMSVSFKPWNLSDPVKMDIVQTMN